MGVLVHNLVPAIRLRVPLDLYSGRLWKASALLWQGLEGRLWRSLVATGQPMLGSHGIASMVLANKPVPHVDAERFLLVGGHNRGSYP
jgi:hypothetical protein